jgi:hypothetical protein
MRTLALGQREPLAPQLLFQHGNIGGGVAPVAIVYGTECRQVWREATLATGATRAPTGEVSESSAISSVVALSERRNREQRGGKNESDTARSSTDDKSAVDHAVYKSSTVHWETGLLFSGIFSSHRADRNAKMLITSAAYLN